MRHAVVGFLAAGLAVALVGCNAHPHKADEQGRVLLENTAVKTHVEVLKQVSDRIEGDLLRVRTLLHNKSKENVFIDIQVVWKDADGFEVYKTNWAPFFLAARQDTTHEIASMRAGVVDYEYRIRQATKTVKP
jgi:uncharacterized protein YcfL